VISVTELYALFMALSLSLMMILIFVTYMFMRKTMFVSIETVTGKAITVLKCPYCSYTIRRVFREGDHVGAVAQEKCPIHDANLIVSEIYTETPSSE